MKLDRGKHSERLHPTIILTRGLPNPVRKEKGWLSSNLRGILEFE